MLLLSEKNDNLIDFSKMLKKIVTKPFLRLARYLEEKMNLAQHFFVRKALRYWFSIQK